MVSSTVYCDNCGTPNRPQARFCIACGQAMAPASTLPPNIQAMPTIHSTSSTVQAESPSSSSSSTGLLPPNSLLNQRYLILGRLGQGGMGAVYKAADTKLGGRLVAVKEMAQKGLDPQEVVVAANGFKREALMLAGLPHHPHLPSIYDHFSDDGRWYLVMDFIEGETLEEYRSQAKEGRLPVEEVLDIGIQLATILGYLHTHQPPIVFRDLKPANVMRTADGQLYLIDFGIARHFKQGQAKDTMAYVSAGYAAPEQYGKAQTTSQSDIYSLGATLHHLLSGSNPSQSPFRFAPLINATVPAELGTLIVRMVDMDVDKRPTSMVEVKEELQRIATSLEASQLAPTQYVSGSSPPSTQLAIPTPIPPVGTIQRIYDQEDDGVKALAWAPDGKYIISADSSPGARIWEVATGRTHFKQRSMGWTADWSPDGTRVAFQMGDLSGGAFFSIFVVEVATFRRIGEYRTDKMMGLMAWSSDSTRIASCGLEDSEVQVWDAITSKNLLTYHGHSKTILAITWSPHGTHMASGSQDETVQVWDVAKGQIVWTDRGSTHLRFVAWSPDGRHIALTDGNNLFVCDAATGKSTLHRWVCPGNVIAVAWSPNSKQIASATHSEKTVQVWDVITGKHLFTYSGHRDIVRVIAWSPDGTRIASGGNDKTVQVWQAP